MLPALEQMLSPFVFHFLDFTRGLSITTPEQMIEKAKGETAYLPCKFTLGPEDQGPLDIEWLLSPADNQKVDQVVSATHSARVYLLEAAEDKALYCDFFLSRGRSRAPANPLMGKEYLSLYRFTLSLAMCMTLATLVASLRLFPHLCVCLR